MTVIGTGGGARRDAGSRRSHFRDKPDTRIGAVHLQGLPNTAARGTLVGKRLLPGNRFLPLAAFRWFARKRRLRANWSWFPRRPRQNRVPADGRAIGQGGGTRG